MLTKAMKQANTLIFSYHIESKKFISNTANRIDDI